MDGGEPRIVPGLTNSDQVIGRASEASVLYLSSNSSAIPLQISKLNIASAQRQPFINLSPEDLPVLRFVSSDRYCGGLQMRSDMSIPNCAHPPFFMSPLG